MTEIEAYVEQVTPVTFVNTTTTNAQQAAQTAALTGGGFVVVWQDGSAAGQSRDIRGQLFDANGTRVGGEFVIDQSVGTAQTRAPSVAATASGGFVVAWSDTTTGTMARAFDQTATALGSQFAVQATSASAPAVSIASMADGHYMITWQELVAASGNVPAHYVLMGNAFDAANVSLTGAFSVSPTGDAQGSPAVAAVGNEFVVTWTNTTLVDLDSEIMAQRFGATGGALGGAIHVNTVTTGTQNIASVAALADGSFVVAYSSTATSASGDTTVVFQRLDHDGNKLGGESTIDGPVGRELAIKAIGLQDGNFIIGWNHRYTATPGSGDSPPDIYAQEFRADGTPMGAAIGYGTTPASDERLTVQSGEGVQYTILNSGHIVTTWTDYYSVENYGSSNDRIGIQMMIGDPLTLLFGDGTANTLTATNHSTAIEGYDGDDTLTGGAGNDQISGGTGNDTIYGNDGNDTIYGSEGNDDIFGDAGNDTIDGGDGDDEIDGGAGSDTLHGAAGNDTLIDTNQGSANPSAIYGDDGDDRCCQSKANSSLHDGIRSLSAAA
jgi:Ca2+-binding RTX toxin-like protein